MKPDRLKDALEVPIATLWDPLNALWAKLIGFIPNLLAVLVLLGIGYAVSAILRRIAAALLRRVGFDDASRRIGIRTMLDRAGISKTVSEIVGALVFWLFMLTFILSAAETLGLRNVSQTIDAFVRYLPNVIGAAVITVVGLAIAHFVRDLVRGTTAGVGIEYARGLASLVYGVLVVVIASLAVGQLQIETALFNRVVEIVLIASGGALALALGLGTREIAKQLVAGVYARELLTPGTRLVVGDDEAVLEEVGAVCMRLKTKEGRAIYVPNAEITENVVREC